MTKRRRRLWRAGLLAARSAAGWAPQRTVRRLTRGRAAASETGMTTAEYAIGTLAACGFAALLVTILRGGVVQGLLLGIIKRALALGG
jgi:Protein of unknown function (DUF4244)